MRPVLFIIFLLSAISLHAQTYRYIYELSYRPSLKDDAHENMYMVLDVNPDETKYYDYSFLEKDSLNRLHHTQNTSWSEQIPVKRKRNSTENSNFVMIGNDIFVYKTNDKIDWTLSDETQKIENMTCQKASANFGGREWTAWFTKDIPISEGPYKFQGLPGLIVQLKDSESDFIFHLVKNKNLPQTYDTSDFLEVRYGNKPIAVTEKTVYRKAKEFFNDPFIEIRQKMKTDKSFRFEANGVKYETKDLDLLTKQQQKEILENYNPLEKNKNFFAQ
ncbi:MAG: GLPGLI family protein [Chryseobacterium sp.]|jgi:GLPGLI family protein|uniref:GLPGLI family protein n=1 Tax=Chryseobacterium sp. TaxID=1871047 RepID=UPI002823B490|nr:GLPGLI family protein [Chryseobacterium sp.]MDR2235310.1 GLPGLI family protein [Chryseobacterium sp.]